MSIFNRPKADATTPWKEDPALVKTQKRLAELDALLDAHHDKLRELGNAVDAAEAEVRRAELEILAGRGSEASLSTKQTTLIAAQRARAVAVLAQEDAATEKAKLAEALPGLKMKAARKSQADYRRRYLAIAQEELAALQTIIDLDARMAVLAEEATHEHPSPAGNIDPELPPGAGLIKPYKTFFDDRGNPRSWTTPRGQSVQWAETVTKAIEHIKALQEKLD